MVIYSLVQSARPFYEWAMGQTHFIPLFGFATIVFGLLLIITAKRRADHHFDRLMQGFNTLTEKLNEAEKLGQFGSFTYDFKKGFSFWSEEMYHLFGLYPRQGAPTIDKVVELTDERDRATAKEAWEHAVKQPGPFAFRFRVTPKDLSTRYIRVQGKSTLDAEHQPMRIEGIAHDITKEVEVDRAKTEFVSLASHQLKTPLTAIGWLAEGLLSGNKGPLAEEQRKYVESIHETNRQMIAIINDLLNVSRIELNVLEVIPEEMDLIAFTKSMVEELRHAALEKGVAISEKYESELPRFYADKNLMRLILQNLLTNAIKYTLAGGSVEVELSHGSKEDKIFIRVSDTGIGIPKAAQGKMFEKLFRAENAQRKVVDGTGLGLYTIKTVVEKVHGAITFDSIEGKGTNFYVTLPAVWEKSAAQ